MDYLLGNEHHLQALERIVRETGEEFEGNCFYYHLTFNTDDTFRNKHLNIMNVARQSDQIVEIGFNAGHSAFLMLIANPMCHIKAFDICSHTYTRPCLDYLNLHFGGRITLYEGDSHSTLRSFHESNPDYRFDAIHIAGNHERLHANLDFFISKELSRSGAFCIIDDTNIYYLHQLWEGYIHDGHISEDFTVLNTGRHRHSIGTYN